VALGALALAALAAAVSGLEGDRDVAPFFAALTFAAGVQVRATQPPFAGLGRLIAQAVAVAWLVTGAWVGVLLVMANTWQASSPPPSPEGSYLGLSPTVYHLLGMYGGLVLALLSAFARDRWLERLEAARSRRGGR